MCYECLRAQGNVPNRTRLYSFLQAQCSNSWRKWIAFISIREFHEIYYVKEIAESQTVGMGQTLIQHVAAFLLRGTFLKLIYLMMLHHISPSEI